ncbi:MAG: energy-coupling factor transporter ATPase, partial [Clostridia bacterium]|nr:energy-coupling factor transporter ATPase [Clostridia bacterium]
MEPEVLVLDEPAAGLDPKGREEILGGIRSYQKMRKNTVIIISHSMEDMARYSDEIVVMNKARIYMQGSTAEVFARADELRDVGLSVPQITELCNKLRTRGLDIPYGIYTVADAKAAISRALGGNI